VWTAFIWLRVGTVVGPCERGNETSGSQEGPCSMEVVGYKLHHKMADIAT